MVWLTTWARAKLSGGLWEFLQLDWFWCYPLAAIGQRGQDSGSPQADTLMAAVRGGGEYSRVLPVLHQPATGAAALHCTGKRHSLRDTLWKVLTTYNDYLEYLATVHHQDGLLALAQF